MFTSIGKVLLVVVTVIAVSGCASTPSGSATPHDPWEGFNRTMYGFNNGVDTYFLKPIAKTYRFVTPDFVETGVSNFFSNLLEIRNFINAGLQGKGKKTAKHTGRFLVNSTVGLLGFFDVAQHIGLNKMDGEDFGQTLATWGAGSGPYVVWPFLGPSTLRDSLGIPADAYVDPVNYVEHVPTRNSLTGMEIISNRAELLDAEKLLTGDRYIFIRDAYLQRRQFLIKDGQVEDTFGESLEADEDF